jgi:uncharacterized protein
VKWRRGAGRGSIERRRGGGGLGGGGLPIPMGRAGAGGGMGLLVIIAVLLLTQCMGGGGGGFNIPIQQLPQAAPADESISDSEAWSESEEFVAFVVEDVQDSWARLFAEAGRKYEPTKTVIFQQATSTGCGTGSAQTGPFYCPLDRKIYIDVSFFDELRKRFRAAGDFAQAYVIAHEYGHHVQNILGIADDVQRGQQENPDEANELSVRMELQADCFAGVWGFTAFEDELLEEGDVEEALNAAAAIGDDRIQKQTQGRVDPESWTHGSSEQRVSWFERGFKSGDPNSCDTFKGDV